MKNWRVCCAGAAVFTLAGCGTTPPELYSQWIASGVTPAPAGKVLVVIQGKAFNNTQDFGSEGGAYVRALANGFQQALPEFKAKIIFKDGETGDVDQELAERELRPGHEIRIGTSQITRRGATPTSLVPVSAAWEMDVDTVYAIGWHTVKTHIYVAQTSGDTCVEGDYLAARCGTEMGKLLADSLRAAHVMLLGGGAGRASVITGSK